MGSTVLSSRFAGFRLRYSTVDKECLAIKWVVDALRYYLLWLAFTVCSDHAHKMKDTNPRITRWYLALQSYNFKVVHRLVAQMVVEDFLSGGTEAGKGQAPASVGRWGYVI